MRFHLQSALRSWNKIYQLSGKINALTDDRERRSYPLPDLVFLLILLFVLQYPSLEQFLSQRPGQQKRLRNMIGYARTRKLPKRDALEDMAALLHVNELKQIILDFVRKQHQNKMFARHAIDGLIPAAIDGIETVSSDKKCCESCLHRQHSNGKTGYFHRFDVLSSIGGLCHTILGFTMLIPRDGEQKQEGELTGGLRLIRDTYAVLGHFADVIVADALYFNAPFFNTIKECGMDAVVRLKDETRKPYKEAQKRIRSGHYHASEFEARSAEKHRLTVSAADIRSVPMENLNGDGIRIIRFIEHDEKCPNAEDKIVWVATTTSEKIAVETIWKLIHGRWEIENGAFNQLATYYHAKHMFCHDAVEQLFALMVLGFNLREAYLFGTRARDFPKSGLSRIDITEEFKDQLYDGPLKLPGWCAVV